MSTSPTSSAVPPPRDIWYLGVDGGGTHCRARLYDADGRVLGQGHAGSASLRFGVSHVWQQVLAATHEAVTAAGLPLASLSRVHAGLGLAGAIDATTWREMAAYPTPFASVCVRSDAHTAVLGAYEGGEGGILIVGTGSCGMAHVDGRFSSVGGWGFPLSDHASGAWLGLQALREALLCHEGLRAPSLLAERLLDEFGHEPARLAKWQTDARPRDFARFAPAVFEAADEGDILATALRRRAIDDATLLARGVLDLGVTRLCLVGGVGRALIPHLPTWLRQRLTEPLGDATQGAFLLARRLTVRERTS
ncbi:N-acetylglucosamine kinase [Billgrantia pellis]|uniref:N-acetylglucosamine kinase n=1 Tax=Billgrantia pellis TaxID=2606936 RepID=A0A7V7FZ48_9GAMM|nr:BadF/BadG/BcrA/BcrD ATPase family protein [Halomonas pellis]KAA0011943.1 N-acetylglucosamine kinase [Halomonas pellis]